MDQKILFIIFISVLAGLNVGSIRKTEDPIRDTQTNPILYEQKKEEEKDGKKGPLLYHVKNVPREGFLTDLPIEKEKTGSFFKPDAAEAVPSTGNASWWEEEPQSPKSDLQTEGGPNTLRETSSEVEAAWGEESSGQPAVEPKNGKGSPTNGEDAWW